VSLSCEETVNLIRSFGRLLSLTVVTVQKSIDTDNSAASEMRTCHLFCIVIIFEYF